MERHIVSLNDTLTLFIAPHTFPQRLLAPNARTWKGWYLNLIVLED